MPGFMDQVQVDLVVNGQGQTGIAKDITNGRLTADNRVGFDPGLIRPVVMPDGQKMCHILTGQMVRNKAGKTVPERKYIPLQTFLNNGILPYTMNSAALPYQTWQMIDRAVIKASRDRLQAWNDLSAANTFGGFDGMAVTGLIRDTMTDPGEAKVDMITLSDDLSDGPLLTPDIVPLPIIHAGVQIGERTLAMSRNSGVPLDTTGIESSGRRCSETLEKMTIGATDFTGLTIGAANVPSFTNNGIYGFRTQPDRITKTDLTTPVGWTEGTSAQTLVNEVLEMIELARAQKFFGPFVLYYSTHFDQFMSHDYFTLATEGATAPTETVMTRLEKIRKISRVAPLDLFSPTLPELLLVQMTSETVRAINGMDFVTVQWTKDGGALIMLRVLGIKVPDLRAQYVGQSTSSRKCGIVHATTA